jgi:O-antigen ligase
MRNVLAGGMLVCIATAVVLFGAVALEHAVIVYGIAAVLGLLWAAKLFLYRETHWTHSPMHWPVLGFLVYALLHYLRSPIEYASRMELFHIVLYGFIYFFAAQNLSHRRERTIVLTALLTLGTLEAMYGVWQAYSHSPKIFGYYRPPNYVIRAGGTYVCPNHLAGLLEMLLGIALGKLAFQHGKSSSVQQTALSKILLAYAAFVMLAGILYTLSRGGWIATALAVLVFLVWGGVQAKTLWPRLAVATAMIIVFAFLLFNVSKVTNYIRLTFMGNDKEQAVALRDPSLGGRIYLWQASWKMIRDHPVLGTGGGTWNYMHQQYRHPAMQLNPEYAHNDILQMISDYGVVGLLLIAGALVCFYWQAVRLSGQGASSEQRAVARGAVLSVSMILIHSWFDFNLHIPANAMVFATLLGMISGIEVPETSVRRVELQRPYRVMMGVTVLVLVFLGVWRLLPSSMADRENAKGVVLKRALKWDAAKPHFRKAISWDSKSPEPYANLGEVCRNQAQFRIAPEKAAERQELLQQAIKNLEAAVRLNRYQSDVILRLASACDMAGELEKARHWHEQAIAVDPQNAKTYTGYGLFLRKHGDDKLAAEIFDKSQKFVGWTEVAWLNLEEIKAPQ